VWEYTYRLSALRGNRVFISRGNALLSYGQALMNSLLTELDALIHLGLIFAFIVSVFG
jgi:hypothetical protein